MNTTGIFTPEALLEHWQGHRRITRRMIEAFPEDKLFTYSIGGMRPFAELVYEFLGMTVPGITGISTGKWQQWADAKKVTTKKELLELWVRLPKISTAFGQPFHLTASTKKMLPSDNGRAPGYHFFFIL